jgi:hypothetical protein
MHILNHQVPAQWQGRSLLGPRKTNRTYFFAARSNFLFGYREGNQKFILNATLKDMKAKARKQINELYDLHEDPTETTNLADRMPDTVSHGQQRLAAWVQYHNEFMKTLLNNKSKESRSLPKARY